MYTLYIGKGFGIKLGGVLVALSGSGGFTPPVWILETGSWVDTGRWVDTETWKDGP